MNIFAFVCMNPKCFKQAGLDIQINLNVIENK